MEVVKVHISATCEYCDGVCYLPAGEDVDMEGRPSMRHKPCPACEGGGRNGKWVTLEEFAHMLAEAMQIEPRSA